MLQITYHDNNAKIIQAAAIANQILQNPAFYQQVALMSLFANSNLNGAQVAAYMQGITVPAQVNTYWWPLSGATAKTQTSININTAKLGRSIASIVNTLVHESVHYTDWAVNHDFLFGDQNAYENPPVSAPYKIGALAETMVPAIH